jgi:hypothetical protein
MRLLPTGQIDILANEISSFKPEELRMFRDIPVIALEEHYWDAELVGHVSIANPLFPKEAADGCLILTSFDFGRWTRLESIFK